MNSYFATVEQQANPYLRNKPIGITKAVGRGCVIAASIEAKRFGVKTGTTVWEARKLCPQIILVPSDMDKYFAVTQEFRKLISNYSPTMEIFSIDEMFIDVTDTQKLFAGEAWGMALVIKDRVRAELGEWIKCSIGIAPTKLLAKLASEMHKPDGLTWLTPHNYLSETDGVSVSEVCGIGWGRTKYLHHRGIYTLGQARRVTDLPTEIHDLVWLKIDSPVETVEDLEPAKSVSRTFTTFKALNSKSEIIKLVRNLVEEAGSKLRQLNMVGRTLALSLTPGFWARLTLVYPTADPLIIFNLLQDKYLHNPVTGIRQAGVWISNLVQNNQLPVFDKRNQALQAIDSINTKFGEFTLYPAQLAGGELIRPEVTGYLGDKYYRFKNESARANS